MFVPINPYKETSPSFVISPTLLGSTAFVISHFKENHLLGLCAGSSRLKNSALPGGEAENARFMSKISHRLDNQSKPSELSTVLLIVARDG